MLALFEIDLPTVESQGPLSQVRKPAALGRWPPCGTVVKNGYQREENGELARHGRDLSVSRWMYLRRKMTQVVLCENAPLGVSLSRQRKHTKFEM